MGPPLRREPPCLLSFCGFENFQVVDVVSSQWVPSRIGTEFLSRLQTEDVEKVKGVFFGLFGTGRPGWEVNLFNARSTNCCFFGGLFRFVICIYSLYIYIFHINTGVNSYYFVLVAETSICKPSSESPSPRDYDWLCRIYIYICTYTVYDLQYNTWLICLEW